MLCKCKFEYLPAQSWQNRPFIAAGKEVCLDGECILDTFPICLGCEVYDSEGRQSVVCVDVISDIGKNLMVCKLGQ